MELALGSLVPMRCSLAPSISTVLSPQKNSYSPTVVVSWQKLLVAPPRIWLSCDRVSGLDRTISRECDAQVSMIASLTLRWCLDLDIIDGADEPLKKPSFNFRPTSGRFH